MKENINTELQAMGATLGRTERPPFDYQYCVPEGYFEGMEDRFFETLKAQSAPKIDVVRPSAPKQVSFFQRFHLSYAIASVLAFVVVGFVAFAIFNNDKQSIQLSQNELDEYMQTHPEEAENEELLAQNQSVKTENKEAIVDSLKDISNEEIARYLAEKEGVSLENFSQD